MRTFLLTQSTTPQLSLALDLSLETLCADLTQVAAALVDDTVTSVILLGHSMGGAVVAHAAARDLVPKLAGVVVVDVVEGGCVTDEYSVVSNKGTKRLVILSTMCQSGTSYLGQVSDFDKSDQYVVATRKAFWMQRADPDATQRSPFRSLIPLSTIYRICHGGSLWYVAFFEVTSSRVRHGGGKKNEDDWIAGGTVVSFSFLSPLFKRS